MGNLKIKAESWLLNVFAGKVLTSVAVTTIGWLVSAPIQSALASFGLNLQVDQAKFTSGLIAAAHIGLQWIKARRMANPNSPAVQTDPEKPGADVPAVIAAVPPAI